MVVVKLLENLRLYQKLVIGFGAVLLIVALSSALSVRTTIHVMETERLNSVSDDAQDDLDLADAALTAVRLFAVRCIVTATDGDKQAYVASKKTFDERLNAVAAILSKDAPNLMPALDAYRVAASRFTTEYLDQTVRLAASPDTRPEAVEMAKSSAVAMASNLRLQAYAKLREDVVDWSDTWTKAAESDLVWARNLAVVSGVLCVVVGLVAAWLITRATVRPITAMTAAMRALAGGDHGICVPAAGQRNEIGEMAGAVTVFRDAAIEKQRLEQEAVAIQATADAERARREEDRRLAAEQQTLVVDGLAANLARLATGDLTCSLSTAFAPEYERLRNDFNQAVQQLHRVVGGIVGSTEAIRSGGSEIAQASDDLSRRTEQQAASLEETAAALDEITTAVRRTAEGAAKAQQVVAATKADADQSDAVVQNTVKAMSTIEDSARRVGSIIGVIDEIAFQTNLLALNAGVEAARAGDAGRGFAVVASEVRALAQRSAEAAKEIKGLIQGSSLQVSEGVKLVGETGAVLRRIAGRIQEITVSVTEIAASAQEQATGLHQVNTAVNQMDQVTQQNAAMVEQATAASHALSNEAGELRNLTAQFKLEPVLDNERDSAMAAGSGAERPRRPSKQAPTAPEAKRKLKVVSSTGGWEEF